MTLRLLIIESETTDVLEKSGYSLAQQYGETLQSIDNSIEFSIASPYTENFENILLDGFDGAVFPGSGVQWSADADEAVALRSAMSRIFSHQIPTIGSCNGPNIAAVILGGRVRQSCELEAGLAKFMQLTDEGKSHPMMAGRKSTFSVPAIHRDQVNVLPDGAVCLASNDHTQNQAFVYEHDKISFWGMQYHPELSTAEIADYIKLQGEEYGTESLINDLKNAETDEEVASRLGTSVSELAFENRTIELRNWLEHIRKIKMNLNFKDQAQMK